MKNRPKKEHSPIASNTKLNSFGNLPQRRLSEVNNSRFKKQLIFNCKEDFHYKHNRQDMSERHLPKYLDFCEEKSPKTLVTE